MVYILSDGGVLLCLWVPRVSSFFANKERILIPPQNNVWSGGTDRHSCMVSFKLHDAQSPVHPSTTTDSTRQGNRQSLITLLRRFKADSVEQ